MSRRTSSSRATGGATSPVRAALTVTDMSVAYGDQTVLHGVSLTVREHRITAFVGPSGCGKSSLLMSLNRLTDLIPGCRVGGHIRWGDQDIYAPGVDVVALRRRIGMIFQRPVPFPFSIHKNIAFALREHGVTQREALDEAVEGALRDVGLWDEVSARLQAPALTLSGGQQQRLCLARALALEPEILLLDEPCSALDPIASATVEDLIRGLRGRYTVVVVTHNLAQARRIADDVGVFWVRGGVGRLVEFGPTADIFERPRSALTRAYINGVRG